MNALEVLFACTSAEEVAGLLRRAGIKGRRGLGHACPVARYLRVTMRADPMVREEILYVGDAVFPTPKPVKDFIVAFDGRLDFQDLAE